MNKLIDWHTTGVASLGNRSRLWTPHDTGQTCILLFSQLARFYIWGEGTWEFVDLLACALVDKFPVDLTVVQDPEPPLSALVLLARMINLTVAGVDFVEPLPEFVGILDRYLPLQAQDRAQEIIKDIFMSRAVSLQH